MSGPIVGQEYCRSQKDAERFADVWRWTGAEWQFNLGCSHEPREWVTASAEGHRYWANGALMPYGQAPTVVTHDDLHAFAMALELADLVSNSLRDDGYFDGKRIDEPGWLLVSQWLRAEVLTALREMAS